jgi:hypothetical protein
MENRFFTNGPPQSFLTLMDSVAGREAHFIPVAYYPPELNWKNMPWTPDVELSLGLWLWHDDRNGIVIYRHKKPQNLLQ